ncbi:MAG: sigma-70 family RNA polymerase sigma factor, partial [Cyclobacteriaceae bacterium]
NEKDTIDKELIKAVQGAIDQLPESRKVIFILSREDGLTYKEIANVLEISIKTVETQMGRALKYLRGVLK